MKEFGQKGFISFVLGKVYKNWLKFKGNVLTCETYFEVSGNQSKVLNDMRV